MIRSSLSTLFQLRPSLLPTSVSGSSWLSLSARSASSFPHPHSSQPNSGGEEGVENLRLQAIKLYKELHRLGRDYPDPAYDFNKRLRRAFEKNAKTTDPAALKKQLELGEHIKKEVLSLISLKKFRHLRRSYHANEGPR